MEKGQAYWVETGYTKSNYKAGLNISFHLQSETLLEKFLANHKDVFNDELGIHYMVLQLHKLHTDHHNVLKLCKAKSIPFSLKKNSK